MLLLSMLITFAHAEFPTGYLGMSDPCSDVKANDRDTPQSLRTLVGQAPAGAKPVLMVFKNCASFVYNRVDRGENYIFETRVRDKSLVDLLTAEAKARKFKIETHDEAYNDAQKFECFVGCRRIMNSRKGELRGCQAQQCSFAGIEKVHEYFQRASGLELGVIVNQPESTGAGR